jgi:hypothetical protein
MLESNKWLRFKKEKKKLDTLNLEFLNFREITKVMKIYES